MTTSRKERAAETEAALKSAAKRVFAERGWVGTKITDITAEAGRAAGSFYNHFASKEALLRALLADLLAEGDAAVLEPGHSMDFTDREAIRFHVAAFWGFYRRHLPVMVALREATQADPALRTWLQELTREDGLHMQDHLRDDPEPARRPAAGRLRHERARRAVRVDVARRRRRRQRPPAVGRGGHRAAHHAPAQRDRAARLRCLLQTR